jgi:transposase
MLPHFTGGSGHDGWQPDWRSTRCRHARGTIHQRRAVTFLEEPEQQGWASELKTLRRQMKATVEPARTTGRRSLPSTSRQAFVTRSRALLAAGLAAGLAAHPPPARRPRPRGRVQQTPAQNRVERLWRGQDEGLGIWAVRDDFAVPCDNTQAERDVRLLKGQQKPCMAS